MFTVTCTNVVVKINAVHVLHFQPLSIPNFTLLQPSQPSLGTSTNAVALSDWPIQIKIPDLNQPESVNLIFECSLTVLMIFDTVYTFW